MSTSASDKATVETITHVHRWTPMLFTIRTTRPAGYQFMPGQYARLGLQASDGSMIWRAYSIVSTPRDDHLEYYGVIVPGGAFTTLLKNVQPGTPIWTEKQSYGFMTADRFPDGEQLWMLATGTGIGPYISMLRDQVVWGKFRHLILVHCVRHSEEFAYQDELQEMESSSGGRLCFVQSATRDSALRPGVLGERITTLLENGELERKVGIGLTVESSRIMLCGNPQMIEDTRKLLHQRGMRPARRMQPGQFVTENYW